MKDERNAAQSISKLAGRYAKLQSDLRKEGLSDIADMMTPCGMLLVNRGLKAYAEEYGSVSER